MSLSPGPSCTTLRTRPSFGLGRCSADTAASTSPSCTRSIPRPSGSPRSSRPVAELFARHWPDAPNLGDITAIDWNQVKPVDILMGGFPCQDVSTAGKKTVPKPGARSDPWSHKAQAIAALHSKLVVIENVRGLLSAPCNARRPRCATLLPITTPEDTALHKS
ncbi:DNA cytosine methyltransferase [Bifidobacterium psychraerophilum]|uniref:DNA cytosine methyltransferase n=1 Tax=Bifidobacterium psychraerophilum TaxID=218140 RepID=UPI00333F39FE